MAELTVDIDSVLGRAAQQELLDHVRIALGPEAATGLTVFQSLFNLEVQLQGSLGKPGEKAFRMGIETIKKQVLSAYDVGGFGITFTCVKDGKEGVFTGWIGDEKSEKTRVIDLHEVIKVDIE